MAQTMLYDAHIISKTSEEPETVVQKSKMQAWDDGVYCIADTIEPGSIVTFGRYTIEPIGRRSEQAQPQPQAYPVTATKQN